MPLTTGEQQWVRTNARYWSVSTPRVVDDHSVADIAYQDNAILLGRLFNSEQPDTFIRRQKISHEILHHVGYPHMRSISYDTNPKLDHFSAFLAREIEGSSMNSNPLSIPVLTGAARGLYKFRVPGDVRDARERVERLRQKVRESNIKIIAGKRRYRRRPVDESRALLESLVMAREDAIEALEEARDEEAGLSGVRSWTRRNPDDISIVTYSKGISKYLRAGNKYDAHKLFDRAVKSGRYSDDGIASLRRLFGLDIASLEHLHKTSPEYFGNPSRVSSLLIPLGALFLLRIISRA